MAVRRRRSRAKKQLATGQFQAGMMPIAGNPTGAVARDIGVTRSAGTRRSSSSGSSAAVAPGLALYTNLRNKVGLSETQAINTLHYIGFWGKART